MWPPSPPHSQVHEEQPEEKRRPDVWRCFSQESCNCNFSRSALRNHTEWSSTKNIKLLMFLVEPPWVTCWMWRWRHTWVQFTQSSCTFKYRGNDSWRSGKETSTHSSCWLNPLRHHVTHLDQLSDCFPQTCAPVRGSSVGSPDWVWSRFASLVCHRRAGLRTCAHTHSGLMPSSGQQRCC